MTEPWFDANLYAWIPGTLLGIFGGLAGGLAGLLAPRGKAKRLVLGFLAVLLLGSAGLLAVGIIAYARDQPYGVWYGLSLPGLVGLVVIGVNVYPIVAAYRRAEERRIEAQDLG